MNNEWNVSMYKRNARTNNNLLITYYLPVCYLGYLEYNNKYYNKNMKYFNNSLIFL